MSSSTFCTPTTGGKAEEEGDEHFARKKKKKKKRKTTTTPLDVSARDFLHHLGLPSIHPLCEHATGAGGAGGGHVASGAAAHRRDYDGIIDHRRLASRIVEGSIFELPRFVVDDIAAPAAAAIADAAPPSAAPQPPPEVGPVPLLELHDRSAIEMLHTLVAMTSATFAMMELWLRFFAIFLCPLCLCFAIHREMMMIIAGGGGGVVAAPTTTTTAKTEEEEEEETKRGKKKKTASASTANATRLRFAVCIVGLASSAVLFTDSLYVYEYGRYFGSSLFALSSVLAMRCPSPSSGGGRASSSAPFATSVYRTAISLMIGATVIVYLGSDRDYHYSASSSVRHHADEASAADVMIALKKSSKNPLLHFSHPGIDLPTIHEGLYHSGASNPLIASVVSHWPERSRTYSRVEEDDDDDGATPYLVNGDMRTGIPFVLNDVEDQEYVRVWARNAYDGEHLALDVAFPYSSSSSADHRGSGSDDDDDAGETTSYENDEEGGRRRRRRSIDGDDACGAQIMTFVHDIAKPVYLLLHGLNGGSHEQYIKDMVRRRREEGSTVVVLIARGMMDTRLVTWNTFHGARTGDVDAAAMSLLDGLTSLASANGRGERRQVLAGVGYSMGAIILSNYVARSGPHCALDAAMSISGGLDMRQQINARRSMRLWQPILTFGLREDILLGKYSRHYKARLTKKQFLGLLRATSISALDVEAIVTYNSFDSLYHYYSEMSAMGDREPEFQLFGPSAGSASSPSGSNDEWGRIGNVSVPFAVLQALDDPLVGWRTVGTNDPQGLADSGSGNVMLLLTKAGGHVGWPLGKNPAKHSWKWMNNAARDFVIAVDIARGEVGR